MTNEQHIDEPRAEARAAATPEERRQFEAELELAMGERELAPVELDGRISAKPPTRGGSTDLSVDGRRLHCRPSPKDLNTRSPEDRNQWQPS